MISRDESILEPNSVSAGRMIEYGNLCDELHIIVLSGRKFITSPTPSLPLEKGEGKGGGQISKNVFIYPTSSFFKFFSIFTAYRIGKRILNDFRRKNGVVADLPAKVLVKEGGERRESASIITTQDPFETGLVGLWLKKKFKVGLNIQLHGDFFGNPYWRSESFLNKIRFKIANRVIPNADSIRVVSERIKDSLKSYHPTGDPPQGDNFPDANGRGPSWAENLKSKIVVAPIFTDILKIQETQPKFNLHERFPGSPPSGDLPKGENLILLWVGKMGKVKNLSFLLKAFKYVLEAFPKAVLVLVGGGPEEERLKIEAKKLGISDSVKFEGEQSPRPPPVSQGEIGGVRGGDLVSYYKTADIFVFPSLYEGWGRVIIEAAAAGLPIVMADVGCAGEVIKNDESGEVVAINDMEGFVRSVTKLGFNPDLRQKYKEAALQSVKNLPDKSQIFELIKKSWELCVYQ